MSTARITSLGGFHATRSVQRSDEVISFGFWPGDENIPDAAYPSYTSPEPEGLGEQPLLVGDWIGSSADSSLAVPSDTVHPPENPRTTLLALCQAAYEAGAHLAGWERNSFESKWCPPPTQLQKLQAAAEANFGR
jgi:hypothetical protein